MTTRYANHKRGDEALAAALAWLIHRGYECYLPISSHAVADVIAVRGAETRLFDVKGVPATARGARVKRGATPRQDVAGVELLFVTPQGGVFDGSHIQQTKWLPPRYHRKHSARIEHEGQDPEVAARGAGGAGERSG